MTSSLKSLKLNNHIKETLGSASSASLNNRNSASKSFSHDDDDERFYDASDAVDNDYGYYTPAEKLKSGKKFFSHTDDEDDRTFVFFDTATSRHSSELGANDSIMANGNQKSNGLKSKSFAIEENVNDENRSINQNEANKNLITNENNNNNNDDDDETDAELETPWSFWVDRCVRGSSKEDYEAGIKLIHTVKTVQTFWSIYNHLPDVSSLPKSYSYHLMRNNRRPLWEDPENCHGGQWKLKCRKEDTSLVWYELLLAGIGEQLSDCVSPLDDIVGLSVGCRDKEDIIQIWNLDNRHHAEATIFEHIQDLVPNVKFSVKFYKPHNLHEAFESMSVGENKNKNPHNFNNNSNNNNNNNKIYHNINNKPK